MPTKFTDAQLLRAIKTAGNPTAAARRLGVTRMAVVLRIAKLRRDSPWQLYRITHEVGLRNELVEANTNLVGSCLNRLLSRVPQCVDKDALRQAAHIGLIEAVERYDPAWKTKFATYATQRIVGAALDELRNQERRSRRILADEKRRQTAEQKIVHTNGHYANTQELADSLGWSERRIKDTETGHTVSLETETVESERRNYTLGDLLAADVSDCVEIQADRLEQFTRGLDLVSRMVLWLYHYRRMSMKEIGGIVGLSESRVSQIHDRACRFLREHREREEFE